MRASSGTASARSPFLAPDDGAVAPHLLRDRGGGAPQIPGYPPRAFFFVQGALDRGAPCAGQPEVALLLRHVLPFLSARPLWACRPERNSYGAVSKEILVQPLSCAQDPEAAQPAAKRQEKSGGPTPWPPPWPSSTRQGKASVCCGRWRPASTRASPSRGPSA